MNTENADAKSSQMIAEELGAWVDSNLILLSPGRIWLCLKKGVSQLPIQWPFFRYTDIFKQGQHQGEGCQLLFNTKPPALQSLKQVNKQVLSVHFCTACVFFQIPYLDN